MSGDETERRREYANLIGAIESLRQSATTLTSEVVRLREWKDAARERCIQHAERLNRIEVSIEDLAKMMRLHEEWRQKCDFERAQFSGGWKAIISLLAFVQGAIAVYIALRGSSVL